jgi:UDP:flavonoid glycosyltransferase YjiC (YdhE family)
MSLRQLKIATRSLNPLALNIVIQVVGSRDDVQPFVALRRVLKETYNHRVRLATYAIFQSFVEENGLEFFSFGAEPTTLLAFMVKNPKLTPSMDSLKRGDVGKPKREIFEIMKGCWCSCFEARDGVASEGDVWSGRDAARPRSKGGFVADAIIANPPSFAHVHCAQKLGIPLQLMFT